MLELNFAKIPLSRRLCYTALILTSMIYPGHQPWQTKLLKPGPIAADVAVQFDPAPYPQNDGTDLPAITARAVVIQDGESKTMMYERSPDTLLLPASTTKIMTAIVALDHYQLDEIITITPSDSSTGQLIKFEVGESLTVESLLFGLLISSGNDAATTLANHYPGGSESFVEAMNAKARQLHLHNTAYRNPTGIDQVGHVTTARDLAVLTTVAMQNDVVARIVVLPTHTITDTTDAIHHQLVATNELVGEVEGLRGLKTGWTENAGECLVTYVERDDHPVVVVVLNSADRFGETRALIDWVYSHHSWINLDNS